VGEPSNTPMILWLLGLAVFGAVSTYVGYRQLKRAGDIQEVARRAGLAYADSDLFGTTRLAFDLFRRGDGRGIDHMLWRPEDTNKGRRVFDYWYYHEDNEGRKSYRRFSCALALVGGSWPRITVEREGMVDRIAGALGVGDIEVESDEFNRLFAVQCEDRRFASALLDAEMIAFLTATRGELNFELRGRWLLIWRRPVSARLLPGLLAVADGFVQRVPRVVWELYPSPFVDEHGEPLPIEDELLLRPMLDRPEHDPFDVLERSWFDIEPREDGPEYDLDGNLLEPVDEDPWGEGRNDLPPPSHPSS
jgi:hypothetical protein